DRIATVPERERQAHALLQVANTRQPIFAPPIGTRARVLMRKVLPGTAVGAVVFAHGPPRPFAQIGTERPPAPRFIGGCLREPGALGVEQRRRHMRVVPSPSNISRRVMRSRRRSSSEGALAAWREQSFSWFKG